MSVANVKLDFTAALTTNLTEGREMTWELRFVRTEHQLGKKSIPELFAAEQVAQAVIDSQFPSQIIEFTPDVEASFITHRKVQLQCAGVKGSLAKLESREAKLVPRLRHLLSESEQQLKEAAVASGMFAGAVTVQRVGYVEQISALDELTKGLRHGDVTERFDRLVALCVQLGAELPEAGK